MKPEILHGGSRRGEQRDGSGLAAQRPRRRFGGGTWTFRVESQSSRVRRRASARRARGNWRSGAATSSSTIRAAKPARGKRKPRALRYGVETLVVRARRRRRRGLPAHGRGGGRQVGPYRCAREQRRDHEVLRTRQSRGAQQAGFPRHLLGEHGRRVPDDARGRAGDEAGRARQHRKRRVDRGGHGCRQFDRVCRVERRAGDDDVVARARARARRSA